VKSRAAVELVLAVVAAVGCLLCWLGARSSEMAEPVVATEPSMPTATYDPSLIVLALLLATIAGVLGVLGVARLRRG
jgi:hypothetical protein